MPRSGVRKETLVSSDSWRSDVWKADDDWTEVDSKEEKKRRQNRINQRAYRRRNPTNEKPSKQRPFRVERFRITDLPVLATPKNEERNESADPVSSEPPVREEDRNKQAAASVQETPSNCVGHMENIEAQALKHLTKHPEDLVVSSDTALIYGESANHNTTGIDLLLQAAVQGRSDIGVIDPLGSMTAAVSSATSTLTTVSCSRYPIKSPASTYFAWWLGLYAT